jgi:hypothetical protein
MREATLCLSAKVRALDHETDKDIRYVTGSSGIIRTSRQG